jgi:hypothetical protein
MNRRKGPDLAIYETEQSMVWNKEDEMGSL